MHSKIRKILFCIFLFGTLLSLLASCGKRPNKVKHVPGKNIERPYKQIYPAPKLLEKNRSEQLL